MSKIEYNKLILKGSARREHYMPKIRNYHGGLDFYEEDDRYYWGIEDYNGIEYQEIPEYLYESLLKFYKEQEND